MRSTLFNRDSTLQIIVQISNEASTQVSEHEPRHIDAPQYQLNCPRHMHELCSQVCARGKLLGFKCLHLWAQAPASPKRKSAQRFGDERLHLLCARAHQKALHKSARLNCARALSNACIKYARADQIARVQKDA